ncbi:MAG: Ig-like domain-containing protein, partial [Verrucomicrobiales bacterium]
MADKFQITLGADFDQRIAANPSVFEGWAVSPGARKWHGRATVALVGGTVGAVIRGDHGEMTELKTDPETGNILALRLDADSADGKCSIDRMPGAAIASMVSEVPPVADDDWLLAEIAPQWGGDPATGEITKYEQPIPNGSLYDLSLPDATVMVVLAKDATGSDSATNLASLASTYLARMANVATIWENQLGIRLLVSELILTPDTPAYEDVGDTLDNFRLWAENRRPRTQFPRSVAARFGNLGFTGNVIGEAFLRGVRGSAGYSINRTNYNFTLVAHELGHNFGTDHSSGGIMNSIHQSGQRDFFRDVSAGETAAKDIYDHAYRRLFGAATMRHAEELPFARDDSRTTPVDTPLVFDPLANDETSVLNGDANTLSIAEVSRVYPVDAGTVELVGASEVLFTPADGFEGFAWFSYSLQGDVGNGGQGWLHRGDVAVLVGSDPTDPLNLTLAPGESVIFDPPGSGSASLQTPAAQAQVDVSRDDSNYLIIRAQASAAGTDSFVVRRGSADYTINVSYEARLPSIAADIVIANTGSNTVRFNPISNDDAVGYRRPLQLDARIGVDGTSVNYFSNALRLLGASNLNPGKGSLTLETIEMVSGGSSIPVLTGNMTFTPSAGATGIARVEYVIEDAAGNQATETISVVLSALEVNQAPSITPIADVLNFAQADFALQVAASDPDVPADQLRFALDEAPPGATINSESGAIHWTPTAAGTYPFVVRVDDQGIPNLSDTESFSVSVTNAAPTIGNQTFSLPENSPAGTEIGTAAASDGDGDTISLAITGGNQDGAVTIDPGSGLITVASSAPLNFETNNPLILTVEATDDATPPLARSATVTLNLS